MKVSKVDIEGFSGFPELDETCMRIYEFTARRDEVRATELPAALRLPDRAVGCAVQSLLALRLLRKVAGDPQRLAVASPAVVGAEVLAPELRRLTERQKSLARLQADLAGLMPFYAESPAGRLRRQAVEPLPDLETVRQVLTDLAAGCRSEVLTSQPGGPRSEEVLNEQVGRTDGLLRRGVRMRTLYQHTAQFSQGTVEHVRRVTELGAEVRTVSDAFMRLIVFDGETAVIALRDNSLGAALVQDPSVVDFAVASFERAWAAAVNFPVAYDRDHVISTSSDVKLSIMRLLVEGYGEKFIAGRLGMSLRTCQRHTAEIMQQIGARNRMHAGYLIHAKGLLVQGEG